MSDPKNVIVTVTLVAAASVPASALPTIETVQLEEGATWEIPLESGGKLKPNAEPTICKYTAPCWGAAEGILSFRLVGTGSCQYFCSTSWNGSCAPYGKVVTEGGCEYTVATPPSGENQVAFEMQP